MSATPSTEHLPGPGSPPLGPMLACIAALGGCALTVASYASLQPLGVFALAFLVGAMLASMAGDRRESLVTFALVFTIGWFMAGIGGLYAEIFRDPLQLGSDAGMFYDVSRSEASGLSLADVMLITEGVGAIVVWRAVYDGMEAIGFEKGRYIGLSINILAVALAAVIASRACQRLYPGDGTRLARLRLMLSTCGLFWLYSAIHLRDASILLLVTLSFYVWLCHLLRPGAWRFALSLGFTAVLCLALGLMRQEFVLVPMVIGGIALVTRLLVAPAAQPRRGPRAIWIGAGLTVVAVLVANFSGDVGEVVSRGAEVYGEQVAQQAAADSLGAALIVQQPKPIRAVVGMAHLLLYPIPVWSGLQFDTAGAMLKSLNAFFFYAFTPLLMLSAWRTVRGRAVSGLRTADAYMLTLVLVFGVGVALTSLESRHFGAFLVPAFCLAVGPDISRPPAWRQYAAVLGFLLASLLLVHGAWFLIKFW
ncbi:MAG: hypothetical protein JNN03_13675 [Rubrivivax sp.]|nr:hypothetical protein [Rubrivivax sp.]